MFSADLGGYTAPLPAATDPPFQKVALLLHGDGTNGAQNNTFLDSSTNNFTITRTGNVAQGTFSPFSLADGQWSNYFDGSGDYETLANNTALDMGSSDFTIEGWFYTNSVAAVHNPLVTRNNGGAVTTNDLQYFISQSGTSLLMKVYIGSNSYSITFTSAISVGQWYHFALVRTGASIYGYLNGTRNATIITLPSSSSVLNNGTWLTYIGGYREGTTWYYANGYISNVRIIKGTALYTGSTYTVPTDGLTAITNTSLLTCQSNRFKDNSSNNLTITPYGTPSATAFSPFAPSAAYSASTNGGSGYFDGSGDYLTVPSSSNLAFGTGDATIEFWAYPTAATSSGYIFDLRYIGGVASYFYYNNSSTTFEFAFGGYAPSAITLGNKSLNTWTHFAIVRVSGTVSIYINGILAASGSGTSNMAATGCSIGSRYSLDAPFYAGYISNLRMIVGTALYTSNFAPPTAPLTAVANTQLLLNCTNAGIIDNAGKNDIETVGNAQISTSVKKYGTGSMYFDGTGDWLLLADRPEIQLGLSDFTIECWIYPATGIGRGILSKGSGTTGWTLIFKNTSVLVFGDGATNTTSVATVAVNTWQHVAVVRSGTATGNIKIYLNGVNVATSSYASTTNFNQTNALIVGADRGASSPYAGYIDDLRITKGQALYTSDFIPPTQAFPNQ